jgi:hypothetical protein
MAGDLGKSKAFSVLAKQAKAALLRHKRNAAAAARQGL